MRRVDGIGSSTVSRVLAVLKQGGVGNYTLSKGLLVLVGAIFVIFVGGQVALGLALVGLVILPLLIVYVGNAKKLNGR